MGAILPELKTKVKVTTDIKAIDKCIASIDSDIFEPVINELNDIKTKINDGADLVADKTAEGIKSYQEMWIIQNKTIDTTQMLNTIFVEPSGQNEYDVGPTALSEDGFPYPLVIEMGSVKYDGKPFVEPALENIEKELDKYVQTEIIDKL